MSAPIPLWAVFLVGPPAWIQDRIDRALLALIAIMGRYTGLEYRLDVYDGTPLRLAMSCWRKAIPSDGPFAFATFQLIFWRVRFPIVFFKETSPYRPLKLAHRAWIRQRAAAMPM